MVLIVGISALFAGSRVWTKGRVTHKGFECGARGGEKGRLFNRHLGWFSSRSPEALGEFGYTVIYGSVLLYDSLHLLNRVEDGGVVASSEECADSG